MKLKTLLLGAALVTASALARGDDGALPDYRTALRVFAAEMATRHGFERGELVRLLSGAEFRQSIIDAMRRPAEAKPWRDYRRIFMTHARIRGGVAFWTRNERRLRQAEATYGVPAEVVVAIIGVETQYGGNTGNYPVLDALTTLAFGYPKRAPFFRGELEEFLLMTREEGMDAARVTGSYAGAMGLPQFMPSSFRAHAVDFDGDGRRDLMESEADAIGSVAAYLAHHGWVRGATITVRAVGADGRHQALVDRGMKPSINGAELRQAGISARGVPAGAEASLIRLDGEQGPEYWLGLPNFYTITRYNHSNLYAMAVTQLGEAIREARAEGGRFE